MPCIVAFLSHFLSEGSSIGLGPLKLILPCPFLLAAAMAQEQEDNPTLRQVRKVLREELRPLRRIIAALAFGPKNSSNSSASILYRPQAISHYMGEDFADSFCLCTVSGEMVPTADIVAGHIFQERWSNLVERRSGIEINDPANIILMHKKVGKKFDSYELTVMPSTYKVKIRQKNALR